MMNVAVMDSIGAEEAREVREMSVDRTVERSIVELDASEEKPTVQQASPCTGDEAYQAMYEVYKRTMLKRRFEYQRVQLF